MTPITIITIVVVVLLTCVIFGLAWLGYTSCIRAYRIEVANGEHDDAIREERSKERKHGLIGIVGSYLALFLLLGVFISGMVYKASGKTFSVNGETALVIESGSMSQFFDEQTAAQYNNDESLHFSIGDICIFSTSFDLVEGEVYGYRSNNNIIVHRLIERTSNGLCRFRGDANPSADIALVSPDRIVYHYTGRRVPGLGAFVLYAQSYFGMWSLCGLIGVAVSSEVVGHIVSGISKQRYEQLRWSRS